VPEVADASDDELRELVGDAAPPGYVAVSGWLAPGAEVDAAVGALRAAIRERGRVATTFGYGPRFLHSTGQLHKGGPAGGRFLQLVGDAATDLEIPGAEHSFGTLLAAQAAGDLQTLRDRGLPAARVVLEGDDPAAAVRALAERVRGL
jgi:glucose-6-phosphate isomerase/transaldolase/glucose-6-phosphate isomerase